MQKLIETLERVAVGRPRHRSWGREVGVSGGFERRRVPSEYYWDGRKRGGDPTHPLIVFQYTVEGVGAYSEGKSVQRIVPGMAFNAIVPSAHCYYLPPDSPHWRFFWLVISHPYIVSRLTGIVNKCGAVVRIAPDSVLVAKALMLLEGTFQNTWPDTYAAEEALFSFLIEFERLAQQLTYPEAQRERLLKQVRAAVLGNLAAAPGVEALAQANEMSRSHYSHYFKAVTGLSPSAHVVQVRLDEVSRLLQQSAHALKAIARATGFADANHLCKVFRRHYHISPGAFRRQHGGKPK